MDYQYGNKKQWRRWLWNRIAEKTGNRRDAKVLFLAGEEAADIEVAERHGFRRNNMIAVERDPSTLRTLRDKGVLTIDGDISDVITWWPTERPVDVVVGDFCCGLELSLLKSWVVVFRRRPFLDATIALNFLRGRDASFSPMRLELWESFGFEMKDRASMFLYLAIGQFIAMDEGMNVERARLAWKVLLPIAAPIFATYSSTAGTQKFDTVVMKSPTGQLIRSQGGTLPPSSVTGDVPEQAAALRRRISAVLAHQTRRSQPRCLHV